MATAHILPLKPLLHSHNSDEGLRKSISNGNNKPPSHRQLIKEGLGYIWSPGGHGDGLKWTLLIPALSSIGYSYFNIIMVQFEEDSPRPIGQ